MIFNPLHHIASTSESSSADKESTSSLMNDKQGICPKCKVPFGSATANGEQVYYCEPCRVTQPIPA